MLLYYYTTILLYYYTTILLYYYTTILLYYYTTILLYYYTTILLYYYTTILLYYYTTILLYYYTTILLYYYTTIHQDIIEWVALWGTGLVCYLATWWQNHELDTASTVLSKLQSMAVRFLITATLQTPKTLKSRTFNKLGGPLGPVLCPGRYPILVLPGLLGVGLAPGLSPAWLAPLGSVQKRWSRR